MGFFKKITRPFKKAAEAVTKPFAKITNKLIPDKLRPMMPYLAGIGSLMLPPGMGPYMRALASGAINVGGQIAADESATGDLSDVNLTSTAIAGGLGYLGASDVTKGGASGEGIRGGIDTGVPAEAAGAMGPAELGMTTRGPGFIQGAENVGREGIASLSEMVQGGRQNLVDIGRNP